MTKIWNAGAASALLAMACMTSSASARAQGFVGGSGVDPSSQQAQAPAQPQSAPQNGMATSTDSTPDTTAPAAVAPATTAQAAAPGPGSPPPPGGPANAQGQGAAATKRSSGSPSGYSYGDKTDATAILAGAPRSSRGGAARASGGGGHRTKSSASSAAVATYPGFAMRDDGGSEVFVQLTKPVDVEEHKAAGVVTYILKGAHVVHRNNENALVTVHFNTPVTRAKLKDVRGGLALEIDLRGDAAPTYKVEPAEGASRLVVDFPQGQFLDSNGDPIAMTMAGQPAAGQTTAKTSRAKRRARRAAAGAPPSATGDNPMQ